MGILGHVLGAVAEVVTGKRYGTFLREEIFLPLGMEDTGFYVHRDKRQRFAQNYAWNEETNALEVFEDCHLGEYYGEDVSFESGGAGLVSTMEDYSHLAQMLLQGGIYKRNPDSGGEDSGVHASGQAFSQSEGGA